LGENTRVRSSSSPQDEIEGRLIRSHVAATVVGQALITCLLLPLAFVAILVLRVAFHPDPGIGDRPVFLALGSVLISLCAIGFYYGVLRYWIGCVRWFRYDGGTLRYRTVLSSRVQQRPVAEFDLLVSRRPTSNQAEAGSWRLLRFRDGAQLKLHVGVLQNASALYERLKAQTIRGRTADEYRTVAKVGPSHPLWSAVLPYLEEREQVWWIGRPVYRKLWSEMAAEVILGLIPGTFGLVAVVLSASDFLRGDLPSLAFFVVGALFTAIGMWCVAAPWRYRRMVRESIYAVTSRRALIIGGFTWGPQVAVTRASDRVQSFTPDKAIDYEIIGRGRDIAIGGEWRKGRRGSNYWGHHGFLAVDDRQAAETALRCLLSTDEMEK
jgi:hypothetical protein